MTVYDVIIIGGGPAGLNAAVVLGRSRRSVLVFDSKLQRNRKSQGIHNFLTRDGMLPFEFLKISNAEISKYGVQLIHQEIISARKKNSVFILKDGKGVQYQAKKILIATGLTDSIPEVKNIDEFYGKSVFHCPYCDAWEVRDRKLGIYASRKNGFDLAKSLLTWSSSLTYFTDGRKSLKPGQAEILLKRGIKIISHRITELSGSNGNLKKIILDNGERIPIDALFIVNGYSQQSALVRDLGCTLNHKNVVITNRLQQTNIPGVYVAGDASRDMHFVVVAAAEGAKAGVTINKELQKEESSRFEKK